MPNLFYHLEDESGEIVYSKNSAISYPVHTHTAHYTIGLILDGGIRISIGKKEKECLEGDFFVILPDVPHRFSPLKTEYTMISICLCEDFVYQCDMEKLAFILKNKIEAHIPEDSMEDALVVLYSAISGVVTTENTSIQKTKEILMAMPENPLPIDLLSQEVLISPYHLIRTFKAKLGLTPHQFQIQSRIRKAQKMLAAGDTITDVALTTGFCDQSHFNKCFQKIVGMTPSEFTKSQRDF